MKVRFIILLLCLVAFFAQQTQAQQRRWIYVATATDLTQYYVDKNFSQLANGNVVIWEKQINNDGSYIIALAERNCTQKRTRQLQGVVYDSSGSVTYTNNSTMEWQFTVPDSIGETAEKTICGAATQKPPKSKPINGKAFAEITTANANLRELPNIESNRLREIPLGEKLEIIGTQPVGSWYKVYDKTVKKQGWLHNTVFNIVYIETKPKRKPIGRP